MSDKPLEKHLAEDFESGLREFLSLPFLERLEKAKDLFRWDNKEVFLALEKYSDFIKQDIENKTVEEREEFFRNLDNNLNHYLNYKYQTICHLIPYALWASHLIFDRTYSQLPYEAKEELRHYSNLDTPKKRKDAFINFFVRFIDEKVVDGGSQSHWNEWTRLYFLSLYERFSIVIENARNDIKALKQKNPAIMEIKKEVLKNIVFPKIIGAIF